jgi:hypothetical protein
MIFFCLLRVSGIRICGDDPQHIKGYNFRMIISVPEFGEDPSSKSQIVKSGTQSPTQLTDQVRRILQVLLDTLLSAGELRSRLNLKHRPTFRNNYLHPALEADLIKMTFPAYHCWQQLAYRITSFFYLFAE